jgi:hypothetical protein
MSTHKNSKTAKSSQTVNPQTTLPPQAAPAATPVTPAPAPTTATPAPAPDPSAALEAYVNQTVSDLDTFEAGLGGDPPLTAVEKRHAAKLRKGGDKVVTQIADLARQHQLESPALQVSAMLALMGKAEALQPLADRLAAFVKHVTDVIFSAQSAAWVMAMQYYALLQRRAATDAELATALQPITQVFAYRHSSNKPAVGSPTKRQRKAAAKAKKTLQTVAGGAFAGSLAADGTPQQPAATPAGNGVPAAPANGNGATPPAAPAPTDGGPTPPARS